MLLLVTTTTVDCVILDGDPDKPLVVVKEEKPGKDGSDEDLQVVLEKGEVLIFLLAIPLCYRVAFPFIRCCQFVCSSH